MFEDIRNLYLKAVLEYIIKPVWGEQCRNMGDIEELISASLAGFEERISKSMSGLDIGMETTVGNMSPLEVFKYRLRETEAFISTKYRERIDSRRTSSGHSDESDEDFSQALREYHPQMVDGLKLEGTELLDQLVQDNCLNDHDIDSIKKEPTDRKKNEQFLHLLSTRVSSSKIVRNFLPALMKDHAQLADGLRQMSVMVSQHPVRMCHHCKLKGKVDPKHIAEILYRKGLITENELKDFRTCSTWSDDKWNRIIEKVQDSAILVEALEQTYPDLHRELTSGDSIENLRKCTCRCVMTDFISIRGSEDTSVLESTDNGHMDNIPAYPMISSKRGICVIIHNTDLEYKTHSQKDIEKLENLFTEYGFVVKRITNLTKRHILKELDDIAMDTEHKNYDAFVCVVCLGGTEKDQVCDVSGEVVPIAYIVKPFRALNCPSLAGKPKVFLYPYASGSRRTPGLVIKETVPESHLETRKLVVPEEADILHARATLPGYTVSSCKRTGSWYINNLLEVMGQHGDSKDLVSCLAMVSAGVGRVEYTKNDITYTQTSHVTSTLRKLLFFKRPPSRSSHEEMEHLPSPTSDEARL